MKTEFHEKVIKDLKKYGYTNVEDSNIGFLFENDSDIVTVDHKFMSTGLRYNKKDLNVQDILDAGFKYFPTWNFYEK